VQKHDCLRREAVGDVAAAGQDAASGIWTPTRTISVPAPNEVGIRHVRHLRSGTAAARFCRLRIASAVMTSA
jgi:hypothetical protein